MYARLAAAVSLHRWAVLMAYAAATAALAWSASGITLRSDITSLLPEGSPAAQDLRFYLERFGTSDALFVSFTATGGAGAPNGEPPDDEERLEEAAGRLAADLRGTGLFRSVTYGLQEEDLRRLVEHGMDHLPVLLPMDRGAALRARLTRERMREALASARQAAEGPIPLGPREDLLAADPLGLLSLLPLPSAGAAMPVRPDPSSGLFLSNDRASILVVAAPVKPSFDLENSKAILAAAERAIGRSLEDLDGVTAAHAGGYLFAVQDEARIRHDITVTASISAGAILILFAAALRKVGLLAILFVPLTCSTLWTLGVAGITPGHLNVVTVAFAAILLGVGDDALTHIYLRFQEEIGRGAGREAAIQAAMASTGPSTLVATLTSGLSFAALTFVNFRGLSELGLIAAIGMANLLVSVFFLFPCLLVMMPPGRRSSPPLRAATAAIAGFHTWARPRRAAILGIATLGAIAAGASAMRLDFSSDVKTLRGRDLAEERLQEVLAPFGVAPDTIHLIHDAGDLESSLRDAERAIPLLEDLQARGELSGWSSPVLWLPSLASQKERHAALSNVPWDRASADFRDEAAAAGLRPDFFRPFLERLERYDDWDAVRLDIGAAADSSDLPPTARLGLSGSAVASTVMPAPGADQEALTAKLLKVGRVASIGRVVADLTSIIKSDFRRASLIALAMVVLTAAAAFRSAGQMGRVMVPVALGCLLMLGSLAALGVPITLMNLVAVPLVFGLGIDFGVYIVNRHEEESRSDVAGVLRSTGGAILLTGMTTLAGFGSLLAADFAGLRSMGWVTVLGISGCLVSALLILPLLLPAPRPHAEHKELRR